MNQIDFEAEIDESLFQIDDKGQNIKKKSQKKQPILLPYNKNFDFQNSDLEKFSLLDCTIEEVVCQQMEKRNKKQQQNFNRENLQYYENDAEDNDDFDADFFGGQEEENFGETEDVAQSPQTGKNCEGLLRRKKKQKYYFQEAKQPNIEEINKKVAETVQQQSSFQQVQQQMQEEGVSCGMAFLSCLFLHNQEVVDIAEDANNGIILTRKITEIEE
eukprot:TRINITY_DN18907_c0_g1_i8.p2 TRINITY_DN18907_c0_g1~~TRINITY_DN18907_c0_g1_i8.p2  ORF type:complete len:216 (+),score=45.32 TRINITY_DN18907_c0_g1_i8:197-844(+)